MFNIYHSKLAIAVDWFVHADARPNSSSSHNASTDSMNSTGQLALVPRAAGGWHPSLVCSCDWCLITTSLFLLDCTGLMHERMLHRQDPSYASFLKAQRERAAAAQQAAQRAKEQQQRDEEFRRGAEGKVGANIRLSETEEHVLAYKTDNRGGLAIEDVLR